MDFRQQATEPAPVNGYYGLSAIPIDSNTFQLVNLTSDHSSNDYQNGSQPTPKNAPKSRLFSDTFLAMLSASMDSNSELPTTPDLSSLTDPFQSPLQDNNASASSINSSLDGSFIAESRPFPESFSIPDSLGTRSTRNASSILSSVPRGSPLSNHPYFTALCDVLHTDLELKKMITTKPNIAVLEKQLYHQLQLLEAVHPYQVTSIRTMYKYQTAAIEQERLVALSQNSFNIHCSDLLNSHYDDQRVQIINRVHQSVQLLCDSLMNSPTTNAMYLGSTTTSTPFKTSASMPISQVSVATTPIQSQPASRCLSSPDSINFQPFPTSTPSPLTMSTNSNIHKKVTETSCAPKTLSFTNSPIARSRPVLSKSTIKKLEEWYTAHEEHPYPNNEVTEDLSNACGITCSQVKKWFANKRNRSKNTKTLAAIACRKRQEKYGFLV